MNDTSCNGNITNSFGLLNKTDTKVIDFINDLKRAIQTGEFQQQLKTTSNNSNEQNSSDKNSLSVISNLINVDNLSNQTFSYIVNWLKEQQPPNVEHEENKVNFNTQLHPKRDFNGYYY